ncbi:GNAT family N-acetyltransferase [Paludibacterium paludis]|uniref:GNAT family acetyltransferase n=1 Tax=Paludibacterium paludis TaxID=1225769 RepID=A0A918P072_9NEIS|nr:GNAT family protein [Paludibacterium paludis]GGY10744.1 GNAT family acetyltransferase [Paludibacterium paludis]
MEPFEINEFGQPVGRVVEGWRGARQPERIAMAGRYCELAPLDAGRHGEDLFTVLSDSGLANWTYLTMPAERAAFLEWLRAMESSADPLFFVILVKGKPAGMASYLRINPADGVIEVGWLHFSSGLQRSAAATEAMYLMMRQAFAWGYRRYEWKCNTLNRPSWRAAERLGFTYEGTFRQARVDKGRNRDTAWFSILDREWPNVERGFVRWLSAENFDREGRQSRRLQDCREPS